MALKKAIEPFLGTWEGNERAYGEIGQKKRDLGRRLKVFMEEQELKEMILYETDWTGDGRDSRFFLSEPFIELLVFFCFPDK